MLIGWLIGGAVLALGGAVIAVVRARGRQWDRENAERQRELTRQEEAERLEREQQERDRRAALKPSVRVLGAGLSAIPPYPRPRPGRAGCPTGRCGARQRSAREERESENEENDSPVEDMVNAGIDLGISLASPPLEPGPDFGNHVPGPPAPEPELPVHYHPPAAPAHHHYTTDPPSYHDAGSHHDSGHSHDSGGSGDSGGFCDSGGSDGGGSD